VVPIGYGQKKASPGPPLTIILVGVTTYGYALLVI
jgi:hypothetical protein